MKWAGHLPEEGVLELALEGGTGFTESMKARWALCVCGGDAGWEEVSGANFCCFTLSLGFLPSLFFCWVCCPQHLLLPLAGVKRPSQPTQYSLSVPSDLGILQVCFLQQFFSIYSVPGSKDKNRFKEHIPHFSDETWGADSRRDLPKVPQLQVQCSGICMPCAQPPTGLSPCDRKNLFCPHPEKPGLTLYGNCEKRCLTSIVLVIC